MHMLEVCPPEDILLISITNYSLTMKIWDMCHISINPRFTTVRIHLPFATKSQESLHTHLRLKTSPTRNFIFVASFRLPQLRPLQNQSNSLVLERNSVNYCEPTVLNLK